MELTLNHMVELIIGIAVFIVILGIVYSAFTSLYQKQSLQEIMLEKIESKLPYLQINSERTVLFDIDEFLFVIFTSDTVPASCSKSSPCACITFPEKPKELTCKNYPLLKNKCNGEGLCYEEIKSLETIKRVLKLRADVKGQLSYGGS